MSDPMEAAEQPADQSSKPARNPWRAVGALVGLGAVIAFVVENSQTVAVRFWFFTGHPRLIYIIAACLIGGAVLGLLGSRALRRRLRSVTGRRRRRSQRR